MDNRLTPSYKCISQESLKLLACITMLIDHMGAILIAEILDSGAGNASARELYTLLRTIGRIAFPLYCFLLAEGVHHTRDPRKYGLRLLIALFLAELPYDLALRGGFTWEKQSVMVTLLLGFLALESMKRCPRHLFKLLIPLPFAWLAGKLRCDYGANGIYLMALFFLTREVRYAPGLQLLGMWFLFSPGHRMALNWLDGITITTQEWAVLALIPISLYSGEKQSNSKGLQWAFYLFYPIHLTILSTLKRMLFA